MHINERRKKHAEVVTLLEKASVLIEEISLDIEESYENTSEMYFNRREEMMAKAEEWDQFDSKYKEMMSDFYICEP